MPDNEFRYVLGIQCFANQDSGACIVRFSTDGKILDFIAISEERLIRKKYPYTFPIHSIGYCMDHYGLVNLSEIDLLVTDNIRINRWFFSGPAYNISEFDYLKTKFAFDPRKIISIGHHLAHASSVYYTSNFEDAGILIIDGNGSDLETTSYFLGKNDSIKLIESYKARGIGDVYSAVTKWILNLGTGGEGKTMGLAPYGEKYKTVLNFEKKLEGVKNNFSNFMRRMPYSDVLNQIDPKHKINPIKEKYLKCEKKDELLNPYFSRVAYDVQNETEEVMSHLGNDLYNKINSKNICVAGGVALNSVANKIMFDKTNFENIFVFPACSDAGIPFGLALWGYYNSEKFENIPKKRLEFENAYTGKEYSDEDVLVMLKKYEIPFKKTDTNEVSQLISDGKIIGWFQGGSEYGPRALGHRSILADSRREEMKDILNHKVKHRESFRPFAPAVLAEFCNEYFDIDCESPYMLLVAKVKKPDLIPAITHVDGTARVQTVTKNANGIFYDLINDFYKKTNVPVILNTSFNDAGEPIVETPEDATYCFLNTEMDYLVLNNYILNSSDIDKNLILEKIDLERNKRIHEDEEKYLNAFCPNYDKDECENFVKEHNKISEWHVKYSAKYELEKKIVEWKRKNTKLLIIGTNDHTEILSRQINDFMKLNIIGFIDYGKNDLYKNKKQNYKTFEWEQISTLDYDEIIISTHEYMYEVLEMLEKKKVAKIIYKIYNNATRSFLETLTDFPDYYNSNSKN